VYFRGLNTNSKSDTESNFEYASVARLFTFETQGTRRRVAAYRRSCPRGRNDHVRGQKHQPRLDLLFADKILHWNRDAYLVRKIDKKIGLGSFEENQLGGCENDNQRGNHGGCFRWASSLPCILFDSRACA
jgi:hypothetical protein